MSKNLVYTPSCVANYFIKDSKKISNLSLNKPVYISYGFMLADIDREL